MIEYLQEENRVLQEKMGPKRILLNNDQRRRLAVKGKMLDRMVLAEVGCLFSPETILAWHRRLSGMFRALAPGLWLLSETNLQKGIFASLVCEEKAWAASLCWVAGS